MRGCYDFKPNKQMKLDVCLRLFVASLGLSASVAASEVAPPPRRVNYPPRYTGVVTAVDQKSITLQGFSFDTSGATTETKQWDKRTTVSTRTGKSIVLRSTIGLLYPPKGAPPVEVLHAVRLESSHRLLVGPDSFTLTTADGTVTVLHRSDQPPRTFQVTDEHRAGGFSPNETPFSGYTYRLADVRVGDRVSVRFLSTDLFNLVDGISILRRPGGKVPPAPSEPLNISAKHHEKMQAWQDWEDEGIPLPYKHHPGGPWPQLAPAPREKR